MKHYLLPLALATALLTACGGGGGGDPAAAATAAANAASDAFASSVAGVVGSASETAPPIDVDAIALGASENKEPMPIS
jgi:hypothetical protein